MELEWQTLYEPENPVRLVVHRGQDNGHVRFMFSVGEGGFSFTLGRHDALNLAYELEEHDWAAHTWQWGEQYLPRLLNQPRSSHDSSPPQRPISDSAGNAPNGSTHVSTVSSESTGETENPVRPVP